VTQNLDIANRSLQLVGTRTNMSSSEFTNQTSNEAVQTNLIMFKLRDELNRMAPWDCVTKFANLTYITSVPTTPENAQTGPPLWQPGIPVPPWAYEYQYPVDCLRARKIIPQYTAQAGGVPIYPPGTVTGSITPGWSGPALKYVVTTDNFFAVNAATPAVGGSGYVVGDIITLAQPTFNLVQQGVSFPMLVGAPAQLQVATIGGGGSVATVTPVATVLESSPAFSGSYFAPTTGVVAQASTTGVGINATFNLTFTSTAGVQRVLLCNQEQAILQYNTQIIDPNVMDPLFQDAWIAILAARLSFQLNGDRARANELVGTANGLIIEARKADGNENLTVNDVVPDFIRTRGNFGGPTWEYSPAMNFDWGSFYAPY
jgi:hypothetical protein